MIISVINHTNGFTRRPQPNRKQQEGIPATVPNLVQAAKMLAAKRGASVPVSGSASHKDMSRHGKVDAMVAKANRMALMQWKEARRTEGAAAQ